MNPAITLIYNGGYKYLLQDQKSFLPMGIFQLKAYLAGKKISSAINYLSQDLSADPTWQPRLKEFFVDNYFDNLLKWQNGEINQEILGLLIKKLQPEAANLLVGLSVMSFEDVLPTLYALKALKIIAENIITIVGGSYLSLVNDEIIADNRDLIDFMVVGDGEYALQEIIEQQARPDKLLTTNNLIFYYQNRLINNPSQYIAFTDLSLPDYTQAKQTGEIYYNFSRGCLGSCAFCIKKDKSQFKSLELIKQELDYLLSQYQPKTLYFIDSSANNNVELLIAILDYLQSKVGNTEIIIWVDFYNFPSELLAKIKQYAETKKITLKFGLESADESRRQYLHKPYYSNEKVEGILKELKQNDNHLHLHLNIIISIPFEKEISLLKTLELIKRHKNIINSIGLTVFHLTANSPIYLNPALFKVKVLGKALNKYNFYYHYEEIGGCSAEEVDRRNEKYFKIVTGFLDEIKIKW